MPAVVKVVIAIETSIDIEFEVTLIPTLWNVNVSDYLLLFKVVFIQIFTKIMILDLYLIYSLFSLHFEPILFFNAYSLTHDEVIC